VLLAAQGCGDAYLPRAGWPRLFSRWASATPAATLLRAHTAEGAAASRRRVNALVFGSSAVNNDAPPLYSAGDDGTLAAWDACVGVCVARAPAPHAGAAVSALAASGCSAWLLASGGSDNAVRVWDPRAGLATPALSLPDAHAGEVFSVAWLDGGSGGDAHAHTHASEHTLASGGGDEAVRLWDCRQPGGALLELEGGAGSVFALAHDASAGRLYAAAGRDVCLFDLRDGAWLATLSGHRGDVYALALGAQRLLSAGDDGTVCEWARAPPPSGSGAELPPDEEPAPLATLAMTAHRGGGVDDGGAGARPSVTALVALGDAPAAFLAATWEGYIVLAERGRQRIRPFGRALLRDGAAGAATPEVPVTALAATPRLVAAGADTGALRLLRMDDFRDAS
jgi:hypothetical protein